MRHPICTGAREHRRSAVGVMKEGKARAIIVSIQVIIHIGKKFQRFAVLRLLAPLLERPIERLPYLDSGQRGFTALPEEKIRGARLKYSCRRSAHEHKAR